MFIEDDELRDIYKIACSERLPLLEQVVLRLEQNPQDTSALSEFLREAHTLKGDSRMLGVTAVETATHHLEDLVSSIQRGDLTLNSDLCDRLYTGIDAIQQWVQEAVTGDVAAVDLTTIIAVIQGAPTVATQLSEVPRAIASHFDPASIADRSLENSAFEPVTSSESSQQSLDELFSPVDLVAQAFGDELLALIQSVQGNAAPEVVLEDVSSALNAVDAVALGFSTETSVAKSGAEIPSTISARPELSLIETVAPQAQVNLEKQSNLAKQPAPEVAVANPAIAETSILAEHLESPESDRSLAKEQTPKAYSVDTIRVESQKLDTLMNQAGELRVTKLRLEQRLASLETLLLLAEEWNRDAFVNRAVLATAIAQNPVLAGYQQRSHQRLERLSSEVTRLRNTVYEDVARLDVVSGELESGIQTLRLMPLATLFNLYPRMVRDLAKQQGKAIQLSIAGAETMVDKRVLEELKDPLLHLIRNAIDHGIETPEVREQAGKPRMATLSLVGYQQGNRICIQVEDDGRGLDVEAIKRTALRQRVCRDDELATMSLAQIQSLIFRPGFSTRIQVSELSGRGVGLDVVRSNVERLKGTLEVQSEWGAGCAFQLQLSTTLSTTQVLIVEVNQTPYAIPIEFVETMQRVNPQALFALEGTQTMTWQDEPISVAWLSDILELPLSSTPNGTTGLTTSAMLPCLILKIGSDRLGILVDALIDQQDIILKPQSKLLQRVRNVTGATLLGTGDVCIVLNPYDLVQSVLQRSSRPARSTSVPAIAKPQPSLLLVEDSMIIRTQMKRLLEGAGFAVTAAVDGLEGWQKLRVGQFDVVVSDVQMPNLDGLELTAQIRQYPEYEELPIVLLTTLDSEADQRRGADAGASAYLIKGAFDQNVLLETLRRLI